MGKSGDPEGEASTAANTLSRRDPKMQAAKVHMLNGTSKDFELHRGSDGDVLFNLVSTELSIEEREYFSLCFYDEQGIRHWMYNDKKILRQLKGLPWEFSFEVKFYPTAPSTLNDDNARYNLFLQLRKDIATARLPATIPTHALLAACIAQSEYGDADVTVEYEKYLRGAQFVPSMKEEQNLEKVKELHREQKGLTASEAESRYLDTCKQLSMYGVFVFNAMDSQHQNVGIGVCASGINVYKDTIRMHRFSWQNIVKISYRKNSFTVKLKAGELDNKKETTLAYKVRDYLSAKRIWKCGVEHHTFFRLIQPEDKPKGGLFRWGSTRFRYQGRTQFQTKMASQMFDHPTGTTQRTSTGRLTQSCDNVNKENVPVHDDKAATLGREGKMPSPTVSPGVSYEIGSSSKRAGSTNGKVGTPLDSDDELVYTPVETPTSAAYYLSERSSLRSPYSSGAVSPNEWSASSTRGEVLYRHTSARRNLFGTTRASEDSSDRVRLVSFHEPPDQQRALPDTARYADLEHIPIQQSVQLYHRGFYNEPPEEPTVRIVRYAPRNGVPAVERLEPINEMDAHPIRFFVNLHHSGESHRVRISRHRHSGVEDVAEIDPANYVFHGNQGEPTAQIRRIHDLVPASLIEHSAVYYAGKDSTTDRAERPNYRLITRILPTSNVPAQQEQPQHPNDQQQQPQQPSSSNRDTEQSRSLPSRDKGKKGKSTTTTTTTTVVSGPSSAYALSSDRYEGPLESVDRKDDLANLPLEHHPRVPYVTKTTTIAEKPSKAAPTDEEQVETENRHFRYIARIRHEGDEDVVDKEHVRPELYGLPSTSYDGPLEDTTRDDDLEHLPIQAHSTVYHSGQSWLKTKPTEPAKVKSSEPHEVKTTKTAVLHVKSPAKPVVDEEKPEVRLLARVLPAEVDDSRDVVVGGKPHDTSSSKFGFFKGKKGKSTTTTTTVVSGPSSAYALSSDRYEGPLESVDRSEDLVNLPLDHHLSDAYTTASTLKVASSARHAEKQGLDGRHYVASTSYHSEGATMDGQQWIEVRVERRVEVQLEPVFCLTGAGLGAVSEDECGLIFTATPPPMAPAGRSFLSLLGFKTKKSKKSKGEHEVDSSESSSSDEDHHVKVVPVVEESGQPHTTVATWQERTQLPDNVTVEYDDQGNRITRTVKTSQVKHTVQKQTFQNYVVPDGEEPSSTLERSREQMTPLGLQTHTGPIVDTQSRSVVYEATSPSQGDEGLGEFVSSKTVTSGNRTIETITYKTERDGIIETHVEHRVTIHSEDPIDHDAELSAAIAEATQMNPDMTVEKIEVRQETSS